MGLYSASRRGAPLVPRDRGHVELEVLPRHEGEGGGRGELNAHRASAVAIGARDGHLGGENAPT